MKSVAAENSMIKGPVQGSVLIDCALMCDDVHSTFF